MLGPYLENSAVMARGVLTCRQFIWAGSFLKKPSIGLMCPLLWALGCHLRDVCVVIEQRTLEKFQGFQYMNIITEKVPALEVERATSIIRAVKNSWPLDFPTCPQFICVGSVIKATHQSNKVSPTMGSRHHFGEVCVAFAHQVLARFG